MTLETPWQERFRSKVAGVSSVENVCCLLFDFRPAFPVGDTAHRSRSCVQKIKVKGDGGALSDAVSVHPASVRNGETNFVYRPELKCSKRKQMIKFRGLRL